VDPEDPDDPGHLAYDLYCESLGWQTWQGTPLPTWGELGHLRQQVWRQTVLYVHRVLTQREAKA
jgi:hypothetical protein